MDNVLINIPKLRIDMVDLSLYSKSGLVERTVNGQKILVQEYTIKKEFADLGHKKTVYEQYTSIPQYVVKTALYIYTFNKTSIRGAARICSISDGTIRNHLKKCGGEINYDDLVGDKNIKRKNVIIDEIYHNMFKKMRYNKEGKPVDKPNDNVENPREFEELWTIVAIDGDTGELLAIVSGERNKKTLEELVKKLDEYDYENVFTDDWKPYTKVFKKRPHVNHYVGKDKTHRIESYNNEVRQHCGRYVRKINGVTQSKENNHHTLKFFNYFRYRSRNGLGEFTIRNIGQIILNTVNSLLKSQNIKLLFIIT